MCNKVALTDCIFCEICNTWIHKSCIKMTVKTFKSHSISQLPYFCNICTDSTMPFSKITVKVFNELFVAKKHQPTIKCFSCSKSIRTDHKHVVCNVGQHSYHQSCLNLTRKDIKSLSSKWSCKSCNSQYVILMSPNKYEVQ